MERKTDGGCFMLKNLHLSILLPLVPQNSEVHMFTIYPDQRNQTFLWWSTKLLNHNTNLEIRKECWIYVHIMERVIWKFSNNIFFTFFVQGVIRKILLELKEKKIWLTLNFIMRNEQYLGYCVCIGVYTYTVSSEYTELKTEEGYSADIYRE